MNAQLLSLSTEEEAALANKVNVPRACGVYTGSKGSSTSDVADPEGSILKLISKDQHLLCSLCGGCIFLVRVGQLLLQSWQSR